MAIFSTSCLSTNAQFIPARGGSGGTPTPAVSNGLVYWDGTKLATDGSLLGAASSTSPSISIIGSTLPKLTIGDSVLTTGGSELDLQNNGGTSTINLYGSGTITFQGPGGLLSFTNTNGNRTVNLTAPATAFATNRICTLPTGGDSNPVIPDTGASNNFLTGISSGGVVSKAQPDIANITATAHAALVGNSGGTAITGIAPGSANNVLLSDGTNWTSGAAPSSSPTFTTVVNATNSYTVTSGVDTNLTMTPASSSTVTLPNITPPTIRQTVCVCAKSNVTTVDAGSGSLIGNNLFTNGQTYNITPGLGSVCFQYLGAQYLNSTSSTTKLWSIVSPQHSNNFTVDDNGSILFYHSSNHGTTNVFNFGTNEDPSAQRNILLNDPGINTQPALIVTGGAATNDIAEWHKSSTGGLGGYFDTVNSQSSSITTVNGSTSGTYKWSMPFQSSGYKVVSITMQALTDAGGGTITYPVAFTNAPDIFDGAGLAGVAGTATTTTYTLPATVSKTGTLLLIGR